MTDDMLRALAKNGGVVGINFGGGFLNQKEADNDMRRHQRASAATEPNLTGKALDDYHAANAHEERLGAPAQEPWRRSTMSWRTSITW